MRKILLMLLTMISVSGVHAGETCTIDLTPPSSQNPLLNGGFGLEGTSIVSMAVTMDGNRLSGSGTMSSSKLDAILSDGTSLGLALLQTYRLPEPQPRRFFVVTSGGISRVIRGKRVFHSVRGKVECVEMKQVLKPGNPPPRGRW